MRDGVHNEDTTSVSGGCLVVLGAFVRSTHPTLEFPLMPDSPFGVTSSTVPLVSTILWVSP